MAYARILCDCCAASILGGNQCSCGCDTDPRVPDCTYCHHDHGAWGRRVASAGPEGASPTPTEPLRDEREA
jgi:hypothetical protein